MFWRSKILLYIVQVAAIVAAQNSYSQSQYRFRNFDTRDGLASEDNVFIRQDSLGFIWISYNGGLSRFDGYNFKVYKFDPNDSLNRVGSAWIDRMDVDKEGNLWVFLHGWMASDDSFSVMRYNKETDSFTKIPIPAKEPWYSHSFEKEQPVIWLSGINGAGLFRFNYETNEFRNYRNLHADSLTQHRRNSIMHAENHGRFLLAVTGQGIWRFDKQTEQFSRPKCDPKDTTLVYSPPPGFIFSRPDPFNYNDLWYVAFNRGIVRIDSNFTITDRFEFPEGLRLQSIDRDLEGVVWISSSDGLHRFDPRDHSHVHIKHQEDDPYSLPTNQLNDIVVDRDQNIWISTSKGISMLKRQNLTFYNHKVNKSAGIETYQANGRDFLVIARAAGPWGTGTPPDNKIYVTPVEAGRLDSFSFQEITLREPVKGDVYDFATGKDHLWIGSSHTGITGLPFNKTTGMIEDKAALRLRHDPKNENSISSDNILGMLEHQGNLWLVPFQNLGVNQVALDRRYGEIGSVTRYAHVPGDSNSVASDGNFRIFPADSESLWFNTKAGIELFHDGRFEHVDNRSGFVATIFRATNGTTYLGTREGLYASEKGRYPFKFERDPVIKNYDVLGIQEDNGQRLWLSNLQGVMMYDPKEKVLIEFNEEDGIDYSVENFGKTSRGVLMATSGEGISVFDPSTLSISRHLTYPVLTRLLINNKLPVVGNHHAGKDDFVIEHDITMLRELILDHRHNNFSIEFAAMQMTSPKKNLYQYQLKGYDRDWIQTDWKNRTAAYTNLDAGTYTFRVKASNHHRIWSEQERTLTVTILPPSWKTWWAYTGYGLFVVGILLLARKNIVQRERLKSSLQLEHLELEKAKEVDKVKTSFFTNISHEFRTPLTLIKGPVQNLLEEFTDNPKVQERLKLVQRNSDLLLKLINQLLDLAKLESGSLKIEKTKGELSAFIRTIASSFESLARQKDVSFSVEVTNESQSAIFDKDKLETILINLINNAIKFTSAGGRVIVSGKWQLTAETRRREGILTLNVSDTGIGIPVDQQSRIFERFHQVSEAHKEIGTGIGLSLVKELVVLMEGNISVTSAPGKGSEFTVTLPLEILTTEHHAAESATHGVPSQYPATSTRKSLVGISNVEHRMSNDEVDSAKSQVLIVEDNSDLRAFIIDSLGTEFSFLEAENGLRGLERATADIPDLIISDVMMPEMDGITMLGKIKKDIRTSHIPLILLTAKSSEDSKLTGLESGADDYLTKPFNKNELLLKVRNRIEAQAKIRERIKLELLSEGPKVEVQSADEQFLQKVKESILARLSDEQLSVESLAEEIGLSRSQLFRKIVALTGVSANELIRKFRLQKAAQLLQQNWGPVSQVAYEVGFSNLSYFSKVFKEEFGVLPSEYGVE